MAIFDTKNLRGDAFGGITAGVIALPLALAFGEASGAGPIAGLWGAIFVGFFAALFGGTGSQISGPTGPMIVVFAGIFSSLSGDPALVFGTVILAGLIQIVLGVLKFGQYIRLVPYPVISGFMSGIGAIIIALQVSRLFGHEPESKGTIPAIEAIPGAVTDPIMPALIVGLLALVIVFGWPKSWGKWMPSPLAALIIGTLVSIALRGVFPDQITPILGDIPTGFPSFVMPSFSFEQSVMFIVIEGAIILAVLGALDSLLTSLVADNMTRTRHNSNQELIGQGIGNTVAGFFGAIPGAGATMRTVVNIRTGGQTKISGMLHSLILLAVVLSLSPLASQIPHSVLAGILVKVGYDIIDFTYIRRAHKGPWVDLFLMATVLLLTVFVDLITAVGAGVFLAALAFIKSLADEQLAHLNKDMEQVFTKEEQDIITQSGGRITVFEFGGPLSFGAAADVGHQVREKVKVGTAAMVLDFHRVPFVDVSAARAVETIACDAKAAGKMLYIAGMDQKVADVLSGLNADHCFPANASHGSRLDALKAALNALQASPAHKEVKGLFPQAAAE